MYYKSQWIDNFEMLLKIRLYYKQIRIKNQFNVLEIQNSSFATFVIDVNHPIEQVQTR